MTITELTPIGTIAAAVPSSVRVFQRHGIDFCCGGKRTLSAVCQEQGLSFPAIVSDIEVSARPSATVRTWATEPLDTLIEHIVTTYHDALREELPRLQAMSARVASVHGSTASNLTKVNEVIGDLSADLTAHMQREESVLFPAIRAIAAGGGDTASIRVPIWVMEREHDHAGALLEELQRLTGGYAPPEWACATVRALYQGLEELERDMHVHVHLENNVLFPRAQSCGPLPSVQS